MVLAVGEAAVLAVLRGRSDAIQRNFDSSAILGILLHGRARILTSVRVDCSDRNLLPATFITTVARLGIHHDRKVLG